MLWFNRINWICALGLGARIAKNHLHRWVAVVYFRDPAAVTPQRVAGKETQKHLHRVN
jgi:hypothetical protein